MTTASPPCRLPGEASSLVTSTGGGDTVTWEEQEVGLDIIEEKQEGLEGSWRKSRGSREEKEVMQGESMSHRTKYQPGRGGNVCNV